ncbi:MAG: efflux RND transporter periplasmic adaptor subunit [Betaproteobacteria bacterium]|nr:efflux RND transporter periplasmic adaptor subunit [Betaproteobacteria bacterium]
MQPNTLKNGARRAPWLVILLTAGVLLAGCSKDKEAAPAPEKQAAAKSADKAAEKSAPGKSGGAKDEKGHNEESGIKLSPEEIKIAGLKVEAIEERDVSDVVTVTATIQANQDRLARLAPRVPGRLVKVSANLGDRVAAGQVLATLDSIEVGEARSAYVQAETEARVAKAGFERAQRLQAEKIVSQKDFIRASAEQDKANAALRAAADKLAMLGVHPKGDSVSMFPLTAPFAGVVIEKKAVLGELAQPDKSLFAIADLTTLWIEANLFEKDLQRVRVGNEAVVTSTAYPNETFKGRLTYIGGVLDKESRTIRGRIEVKNADGRLKPEMFASAAITTGSSKKGFSLPDTAVVLISEQPTIFVQEGERFEARPIEIAERLQGRVLVKAGVAAGDPVVMAGAYALKARLLKSQIGDSH